MGIIDLQEVSPGVWSIQYEGHQGVYSIHAAIDRGKIIDFSCTCPSKHTHCKHLSIVKEAIVAQITERKNTKDEELERKIKSLIRQNSKEFSDIIVAYAKKDTHFLEQIGSLF